MYNPENMQIIGSTFSNNEALNSSEVTPSGIGGGIYYTTTPEYLSYLAMPETNTFTGNYADDSGGAVNWDELEPEDITTNDFRNNNAGLYGDDIACFAQMLVAVD